MPEDTITLNDEEITLKGDDLFLFNAFMRLRDKNDITVKDIRKFGFRRDESPAGTVALSIAIRTFREKIQARSGSDEIELISKQGANRSTTYSVNPAVIQTDFVREGSTVTVHFLDDDEDDTSTFRVPNRYKDLDPKSPVKLLDHSLPLYSKILGAKVNENLSYETGTGQSIALKIMAIE